MSPLSNLQALAISAVAQIVAVAVALALISSLDGQIITSAAGSVIALAVGFYQFLENQKTVAAINAKLVNVDGTLKVK